MEESSGSVYKKLEERVFSLSSRLTDKMDQNELAIRSILTA